MTSHKILGSFEQVVLLGVLQQGDSAFGLEVRHVLEENLGRPVSRGAFYTTVDRLAKKQYLVWETHGGDPDRQRLPKRRFKVTTAGLLALKESREVMFRLSRGLDELLGHA